MNDKIFAGQNSGGDLLSEEQLKQAEEYYRLFLQSLGYNVTEDPNMVETPRRVVKMFTQEIAKGSYQTQPKTTTFTNEGCGKYSGVTFQGNISVKSLCSHHLMPFFGKCHIAYIPGNTVIGLSKLNRIVDWFCRRPQIQEQLTVQIHSYLKEVLGTDDVAVYIEANHTCVSLRGIEQDSVMRTSELSGSFYSEDSCRSEFYQMVNRC